MKIIQDNQSIQSVPSEKTEKNKKTGDGSFGKMLDSMIKKPSKTEAAATQTPILNTGPVIKVKPSQMTPDMKQPVIEQTEKLLNLLDEYRQKLADPQFTLKDINPIVERLSTENKNLTNVMNALPKGDGLKEIMQKSLITSSLEVIRFDKGEYIDS